MILSVLAPLANKNLSAKGKIDELEKILKSKEFLDKFFERKSLMYQMEELKLLAQIFEIKPSEFYVYVPLKCLSLPGLAKNTLSRYFSNLKEIYDYNEKYGLSNQENIGPRLVESTNNTVREMGLPAIFK